MGDRKNIKNGERKKRSEFGEKRVQMMQCVKRKRKKNAKNGGVELKKMELGTFFFCFLQYNGMPLCKHGVQVQI